MNKHKDCKRQFSQLSRAWYGKSILLEDNDIDVISIGFYHPEGGTSGEFEISWRMLGGNIAPKLSVYDDAWSALFNFSDLLESMAGADDKNISPDEFCKLLLSLGIEDVTKIKEKEQC